MSRPTASPGTLSIEADIESGSPVAAVEGFLNRVAIERDLPAVRRLLDPEILFVGTGADEWSVGADAVMAAFSRDTEQFPEIAEVRCFDVQSRLHADSAVIQFRTTFRLRVGEDMVTLPELRWSAGLARKPLEWRFTFFHISAPMYQQPEGQSLPSFEELRDRNRTLERLVTEQTRELASERNRSESLLRNILPEPIAERLKAGQQVIADRLEGVTVLFADIAGFTPLSARISPLELVSVLDRLFTGFDEISARYGAEKIKTIGDAYMAAAGVPEPREDHVQVMARVALDFRDAVLSLSPPDAALDVRIGMHTGPVVAGVIGRRKFSYDLWGDTVNIASRLESHGERGRIHISEAARAALGPGFRVVPRGEVELKGRGRVSTFWLEGEGTR